MKVHWFWIGVGGWCRSVHTMIVHIGGKISAADGSLLKGIECILACSTGDILLKSLNCCYLLIDKVFGGVSSFMMARVVMMMVLQ